MKHRKGSIGTSLGGSIEKGPGIKRASLKSAELASAEMIVEMHERGEKVSPAALRSAKKVIEEEG